MKNLVVMILVAAGLVLGTCVQSFASDWDKAGKALAIIEGVRIVTGGAVDVIGNVAGINKPRKQAREREYARRDEHPRYYTYEPSCPVSPYRWVWVPHIVWKEKYVPSHTEYRPGYAEVLVDGHYEKYKVEQGGHWEKVYCD